MSTGVQALLSDDDHHPEWMIVGESHPELHALFQRHYSNRNPQPRQARLGPGDKTCLLLTEADYSQAAAVWINQRHGHLTGLTYLMIYRNETARRGGPLLLSAERYLPAHYPRSLITYVDTRAVAGDGKVFKVAGWHKAGRSKKRGLLTYRKELPPI